MSSLSSSPACFILKTAFCAFLYQVFCDSDAVYDSYRGMPASFKVSAGPPTPDMVCLTPLSLLVAASNAEACSGFPRAANVIHPQEKAGGLVPCQQLARH